MQSMLFILTVFEGSGHYYFFFYKNCSQSRVQSTSFCGFSDAHVTASVMLSFMFLQMPLLLVTKYSTTLSAKWLECSIYNIHDGNYIISMLLS